MEYTAHQKRENDLDCTLRNALLPLEQLNVNALRKNGENRSVSTLRKGGFSEIWMYGIRIGIDYYWQFR